MNFIHLSHAHTVTLYEAGGGPNFCDACGENVQGPYYSCEPCDFYIHKSCAEAFIQLEHPMHDRQCRQPLILLRAPPSENGTCKCEGCNSSWRFAVYHCPICKFYLDIKCALLPIINQFQIHEHPLNLFRKSITFICDACGKEGKGMSYLCVSCSFNVHPDCTSFPSLVKLVRHGHPLILTFSLKDDQSEHQFCRLCVRKVDTNYGFYYCENCNFAAHLVCAMDKKGWDETFLQGNKDLELIAEDKDPELDEFTVDTSTYVVKETKLGVDNIEMETKIKHESHEHDLMLTDKLEKKDICDGCTLPIVPPFYSCVECSFFLHKCCVKLPRKNRHPLHQHPLTLLLTDTYNFQCSVCNCTSNGFIYMCDKCPFQLDVQCSLVPDTIIHEGHEHMLFLSSTSNYEKCSACNSYGNIYRCKESCDFTLDFLCATLQRHVMYKQHEHPFVLRYKKEDDSDEYYCSICEEERDPKLWFYYCEACDYPAHPKCIIEGNQRIKIGGPNTCGIHRQALTRVNSRDHRCEKCSSSTCNGWAFECKKCKLNIY